MNVKNPPPATVAGYLLTRLAQAGLISVFGVPGDGNLALRDAVAAQPGLNWIAMATEQGAACAADSYARLRGIGAVVTTSGAGELSAMSAIAGAYAESVPVVHIVCTPALATRASGAAPRRGRPSRDYRHFLRMAAEVTEAQADLRPDSAPAEIDRVLGTALRTSRPVYLALPADVAGAEVPPPAGRLPRTDPGPGPGLVAALARRLRRMSDSANRSLPASAPVGGPLTQCGPWAQVEGFLRPGDLIIAGRGTAFRGADALTLPDGALLVGQPLRAPAGWSVPAALGASLAEPGRRVVLIAGEHALQQALPEFGTLLGLGLAPVIIMLARCGRPIEQAGHQPELPAWDWSAPPTALGPAAGPVALRASTPDELAWALDEATHYNEDAGRPVVVEVAAFHAGDARLAQGPVRALAVLSR